MKNQKIKAYFSKEILTSPYFYLSIIAIVLVLSFFILVSSYSGTLNKFLLVFGLIALAGATSLPDRFRPFISFRVSMITTIMIAAAFGPVIGYVVSVITALLCVYIGKFYYPLFIVRSITISSFIVGVLPGILAVTPENIASMSLFFMLLLVAAALPFHIFIQERPMPQAIASLLFNVYWQYIIIKIYGPIILTMLLA